MKPCLSRLRPWVFLVGAVALALSACVHAESPLSDALKSEPDNDLVGTWMMKEDKYVQLLMIGRHTQAALELKDKERVPRGIMTCCQARLDDDGRLVDGAPFNVAFFVSKIGGETYLNGFDSSVVDNAANTGQWGYPPKTEFYVFKYRVQKNVLEIWYPDHDKLKAAIKKGAIAGEVRKGQFIESIVVKDGRGMADYLAREGSKALFNEENAARFVRAKVVPVE